MRLIHIILGTVLKITEDPESDPKPKRKERKAKAGKGKNI